MFTVNIRVMNIAARMAETPVAIATQPVIGLKLLVEMVFLLISLKYV
jgi:hypothetical protein